jgi:hypothetical protein
VDALVEKGIVKKEISAEIEAYWRKEVIDI